MSGTNLLSKVGKVSGTVLIGIDSVDVSGMRQALLSTLLVLALAASAEAQILSPASVVTEADSQPLPGVPPDGIWAEHRFLGTVENSLIDTFDGGYIEGAEFMRLTWNDEKRAWKGTRGTEYVHSLPLGNGRVLFESRSSRGSHRYLEVAERSGDELRFHYLDLEEDRTLRNHLEARGLRVVDTELVQGILFPVVHGTQQQWIDAMRTVPLNRTTLDHRLRPPSSDEMAIVWTWFEVQRWTKQQRETLDDLERNLDRLQSLGGLHMAHLAATSALDRDLANLDDWAIDDFAYGHERKRHFERLEQRADELRRTLNTRLEARLDFLSEHVEFLDRESPADPTEYVRGGASPGQALEFHVVATREDGTSIVDTRQTEEPWQAAVMGNLPEGIQYGLRTMNWDEVVRLRLPAGLAFGPEHGTVTVELEILRSLPQPDERPNIVGLLSQELGPVEATLTASGLRYRDLAPGEGTPPAHGSPVVVNYRVWNPVGELLDEQGGFQTTLGSDDLMPGVHEALASMRPGGARIVYVPRRMADEGMARAVFVQLVPEEAGPQ